MQAAIYVRRVFKACDLVQGTVPRWCSSGAAKVLQPRLSQPQLARRVAAASSGPAISEPHIGLVLSSQANYYRVRVECPNSVQGVETEQVFHFAWLHCTPNATVVQQHVPDSHRIYTGRAAVQEAVPAPQEGWLRVGWGPG